MLVDPSKEDKAVKRNSRKKARKKENRIGNIYVMLVPPYQKFVVIMHLEGQPLKSMVTMIQVIGME